MSTIIEVMLAIRERSPVYYHKDTKQFDRFPYSKAEKPNPNIKLTLGGDCKADGEGVWNFEVHSAYGCNKIERRSALFVRDREGIELKGTFDFLNYGNPYQELRTAVAKSEESSGTKKLFGLLPLKMRMAYLSGKMQNLTNSIWKGNMEQILICGEL